MKQNFLLIFLFLSLFLQGQELPAYKNPSFSNDARANDLLKRMNLQEKFWQLYMLPFEQGDSVSHYKYGVFGFQFATAAAHQNLGEQILSYGKGGSALEMALAINTVQQYIIENSRLGIPIIAFDESLHGLVREHCTVFPQSIGLAATFDTCLMHKVSAAIATEVKARGIRQILSPVINVADDPRWGRTEETYGSDPWLTSVMGLAYISEFEKRGIITTPKHFIANSGDAGRDSYPIHYNERLLLEKYLPPFEMAIKEGKARSIMTAYNSYDGTPCTSNAYLLRNILKNRWAFKGFVISDASATGGANVLHYISGNYHQSAAQAIAGGLDVIFQTSYSHYPLFYKAFSDGLIRIDDIDSAVKRVLLAKLELGLFEHPYVDTAGLRNINFQALHWDINKEAALKSLVLLKNSNVLPLNKKTGRIAVIGEDAVEARPGGYSRDGRLNVSILEGIKNKIGAEHVLFAQGSTRNIVTHNPVEAKFLTHIENGISVPGLHAEYYNNIQQSGLPELKRTDEKLSFAWTLYSPDPEKINFDFFSVCWTGFIEVPVSGTYEIGLRGNDGYRLYVDDCLIVDNYVKKGYGQRVSPFWFEGGKKYKIKVDFYESTGNARIELIWNYGVDNRVSEKIEQAVSVAKKCDVVIFVAGIEEGEFRDRALLALPGNQEETILELCKLGKPVVVILTGGSAIVTNAFYQQIGALIDAWYPGDEGGNAVADVLFGDYNPAGRLPLEFPMDESQLPYVYYHKPTGRGDDYNNLSGKPFFPFGYGLSYTTFEYTDFSAEKSEIKAGEKYVFSFSLKNTGKVDGEEVVQVYLHDVIASVSRPLMELKAVQRVFLKSGESKKITIALGPEVFEMYNAKMEKVIEPGDFRIMIGSSSVDIRLREMISIK